MRQKEAVVAVVVVQGLVDKQKVYSVGFNLKRKHFSDILKRIEAGEPFISEWFEIITENFLYFDGRPRAVLKALKSQKIPVIPHGLALNLCSTQKIDQHYLDHLAGFLEEWQMPYFSDHLCLSSSSSGKQYFDLIPPLRTYETVELVRKKIEVIKEHTQKPFLIENISRYTDFGDHEMDEATFYKKILENTGAYALLDINNIYVNGNNFKFDPYAYIDALPLSKVLEIHLAGHIKKDGLLIDTHSTRVATEVFDLFKYTLQRLKQRKVNVLLEWDHDVPSFAELENYILPIKEMTRGEIKRLRRVDDESECCEL